jgi:hypothetical protein
MREKTKAAAVGAAAAAAAVTNPPASPWPRQVYGRQEGEGLPALKIAGSPSPKKFAGGLTIKKKYFSDSKPD